MGIITILSMNDKNGMVFADTLVIFFNNGFISANYILRGHHETITRTGEYNRWKK